MKQQALPFSEYPAISSRPLTVNAERKITRAENARHKAYIEAAAERALKPRPYRIDYNTVKFEAPESAELKPLEQWP
jgi:hypothetical protein